MRSSLVQLEICIQASDKTAAASKLMKLLAVLSFIHLSTATPTGFIGVCFRFLTGVRAKHAEAKADIRC